MITIQSKVHFWQGRRSRKELRVGAPAAATRVGRVPRVSRLMALAIRFDQLIRDGIVKDLAELARLGHVTRARLTQIMNLLSLAPDLQEQVLFLPAFERGRNRFTERDIRPISSEIDWAKQRGMWRAICAKFG